MSWNLKLDVFTFDVSLDVNPFTRRGILSTINSLFDPLGFIAPVTVQGNLFLRNLMKSTNDWNASLPEEYRSESNDLRSLQIPRTYSSVSLRAVLRKELHVYSDASEKAVAAVAYIQTTKSDGTIDIGFVLGNAKVAPLHGTTIPRLELCCSSIGSRNCRYNT